MKANAVVAREIARRYADKGILSFSCNPGASHGLTSYQNATDAPSSPPIPHPGNLRTDLGRHMSTLQHSLAVYLTYPPPMGALTQLWAGTMPDVLGHNGDVRTFLPYPTDFHR